MKQQLAALPVKQLMDKVYYLPVWRGIVIGTILVLMGLSPIFMNVMIDGLQTLPAAAANFFTGFIHFPEVIISLLFTVIFISGVLYLKRAKKIVRARIDDKGFYYLPIAEGTPSRGKPIFNLFYLTQKLRFIAYTDIARAEYVTSKWRGDGIDIHFANGETRHIRGADVLYTHQKHDIVDTLNAKIQGPPHHKST